MVAATATATAMAAALAVAVVAAVASVADTVGAQDTDASRAPSKLIFE